MFVEKKFRREKSERNFSRPFLVERNQRKYECLLLSEMLWIVITQNNIKTKKCHFQYITDQIW